MSESTDINETNREVISQFRANNGNVITGRFAGSKLLLLTTKGARTGQTRVNPMMYYEDGDRYVVFASKRAAPVSPDWYHNLVANPQVTVEVGTESFSARATVARDQERTRVWRDAAAQYPVLDQLQSQTRRQIPVVILEKKR